MKAFLKLALVFFVLSVIIIGGAFFVLTRPSVQKSLIEGRLPEGSRLEHVQVTLGAISLHELEILLPDGTKLHVGDFQSEFSPFTALFDRTIDIDVFRVEGLVVDLPQPILSPEIESAGEVSVSIDDSGYSTGSEGEGRKVAQSGPESASGESDPFEAIYQLEKFDWLLDIESIQIDGEIRDSAGSVFGLKLESGALKPGEATRIEAELQLNAAQELKAGLKDFVAAARVDLMQDEMGGFSRIAIESTTDATDTSGESLLSISQNLLLEWDAEVKRSELTMQLAADIPQPDILVAELEPIRNLGLDTELKVVAKGEEVLLETGIVSVRSEKREVARLDLQQVFNLRDAGSFEGELIRFRVSKLPLSWVRPWLPEEFDLRGAPISLTLSLSGVESGGFELSSAEALVLGPVSVYQGGEPLLLETSFSFLPKVTLEEDGAVSWEITDLKAEDRYGPFFGARSVGRFDPSDPESGLIPSGLSTETDIDVGLLELSQQPFLQGKLSLLTGRFRAKLIVSEDRSGQVTLESVLAGLSSRGQLGFRQDYRFAFGVVEKASGDFDFDGRFQAGSDSRPSTSLVVDGAINPSSAPLKFNVDVQSKVLKQSDVDLLVSAFSPSTEASPRQPNRGIPTPSVSATGSVGAIDRSAPPPWASLDGSVRVAIDRLIPSAGPELENLSTSIMLSEPLLEMDASGDLAGSAFQSMGQVRYGGMDEGYGLEAGFTLANLDPAKFSRQMSGSFPIEGIFDGEAKVSGEGVSLDAALEDAQGSLSITGRKGVLTAFELKGAKQAGLIGASLLGQFTQQQGITALAGAVPYFQNIPYESFVMRLERDGDKNILIPELRLTGESVLIDGSGSISIRSLKGFFTEPLNQQLGLDLKLGAKGRLAEYLKALQLLGNKTSADGYTLWNRDIQIGGTLGKPDTSILERILNEAARRAFTGRQAETKPETAKPADTSTNLKEQSKPRSKEEQLIRDVETGVQLLNSLFGN